MARNYDFCGWATRNDIKCSDGRTIKRDAFKECDGLTVPLVWNHDHNDPTNVLGHAMLFNKQEGVWTEGYFNDTETGQDAKKLVQHGDIRGLSIFANKLKQNGGDVVHGVIREVSLVLAGANPGAYIEAVISHGEEDAESAIFSLIEEDSINLSHAEEAPKEEPKMAEKDNAGKEKTVQDVFDTLNDEQKELVYALVGKAVEDALADKEGGEEVEHNDEGEDAMYNVFEDNDGQTLSHSAQMSMFNDALTLAKSKSCKLSDAFNAIVNENLGEELAHSIDSIDLLFPDFHELNNTPKFIRDPDDWVSKVMGGVHHTPYSKIKTTFADITEPEARARGYITGTRKLEEVFYLLKRTTQPTTVYKLQKLDRDTILDITSFDVVAWMKGEQRMKLDEELARAFLVGDGRSSAAADKIDENCIRPIWTDDDLFTIKHVINVPTSATEDQTAKAIIRESIKSMDDYRGTGTPTLFIPRNYLTMMLLMEDSMGRVIYDTVDKLKSALQVKDIVVVPAMKNLSRVEDGNTYKLAGIIVNLADYNVGADKGGEVNFFEDFILDFNKYEYLVETRCSAALTEPFSAIALEILYGLMLNVEPTALATVRYGKAVSDLQKDVIVHDEWISGTLKYVTGYTGFSGDVEEQSGNYLALDFTFTDGATATAQLINAKSIKGPVDITAEPFAVIRVTNPRTQKLVITVTKAGETVTRTLSFSSLKCEQA